MYLTFDSSILISDYYLKGYIFKLILENHDDCGYKLLISDIVLEETSNKFGEELWDFNRINKRNFQIIPEQFLKTISKRDIDILKVNYAQYLENSFERIGNKKRNVRFYGFNSIEIERVFQKAISKKKPFRENEKGFRDALIWENIVEMVRMYYRDETPIIFITANYKDFCSTEKSVNGAFYVHDELKKDLLKIEHPVNSVIVYTSLKQFYENEFSHKLNELNLLKSGLLISEDELRRLLILELLQKKNNASISIDSKKYSRDIRDQVTAILSAKIERAWREWVDSSINYITLKIIGKAVVSISNKDYVGDYTFYVDYYPDDEKKIQLDGSDFEISFDNENFE
ncbi:PIN domain-containing protein [Leptospira santarosai]|uniref:DUF4935 domain-containing protein n=1 Tax=Leptospira santarosai serovar Arenal str. MAVJ 401 TaxID=1049976 RepID=M6JJU5_9LEPT|nr:PIN domain-containing protein [Leptospira santarosai]ASV13417.1 DUF4935 domain-containing protein [Leptospira santarosai]AVV81037.1 Uncharacterized protein XB15_03300 [Leptospira santarosai]EMM75162.1 hypothetical protein LEP1GSC040_0609 [Leptospira santarosai str. 2000030832]EMN22179.1 hypothetical protein LEP1GSC063_0259 [Leptospira santarosai serovar Arenal str. MAVJ 401]MDO6381814.1 PIN domain-containing protein [Leptospira santarosai]